MDNKIKVLIKVAKLFNDNNITWAIGASLLLYLKGISNHFNDIDIMVAEKDAEKVKRLLLTIGILQPDNPNVNYKTKVFMEFNVDGVDIDIMAGFTIMKENKEYYFPLDKSNIESYFELKGTLIPMQSIEDWLLYYKLMNRLEKVEMINRKCEVMK